MRHKAKAAGDGIKRARRRLARAGAFVTLFIAGMACAGLFATVVVASGTSTGSTDTQATSSASTSTDTAATTTDASSTTTDSTTTAASQAFAPSISTDANDYPPGGTVTLTGANWLPGESVHIFANDSIGQTWQYSSDVTADAAGNFTLQFQLSPSFVSNYTVTATSAAGETATAAFTDSQPQAVSVASPTTGTVTPGQTATYGNVTVQVGGNASSCTVTLVASTVSGDTGLPGTASASFTPNPNTVTASYTTTSFSVATTAATAGGTYTFHVAAQRGSNCQGNGDIQSTQQLTLVVNAKVNQATLSITAPNSATFGGSDQTITTTGGSGTGAITFDAGTSTACSIVSGKLHVTSGTGTCSITATKAGDANFNPTTSASHDITINKATPTCAVSPYHVTYNGNTHTATGQCTGVGGAGDVLTGLDLSGTTHTNAGDYPSDPWTFPATTNYSSASGTVHDVIDKANAHITVTPYHVTYDGNTRTATGSATGVESPSPADLSSLLHLGGTTHTNAGDYPSDPWTFDGNSNYNSASGTVHDAIDKANAHIAVTPYSVVYDGSAHTATGSATGVESPSPADLSALLHLGGTTHTNAGDYVSDPWTFDGNSNYNADSGTVHDHIDRADPSCSVSGYSVTYDGGSHTATGQCTGVGGSSDVLTGLDLSGTTHTAAGDYPSDPWSFAQTTNYNSASSTVHDLIDKADATCSVTGYTKTFDGNSHTAAGQCTGVGGASDVLSGLDLSGTTHTHAGDFPSDPWSFTDVTGNYNNQSGTVHDHIDKADATCSITSYSVTFDGNSHTATGSCFGVGGPTDLLAGLDVSGTTHTHAGDFPTDPWTFTDTTGNYNNQSGTVHDHIDKANATCSVTGYTKTFDGNSHTATGQCTGVGGASDVLAGLDLSGTTHTHAGDFPTDPWTFTDTTGNYNNQSGTVHDHIDKADATCAVTLYSVVYDGNPHTATGQCTGVGGASDVLAGLDLSGTTHTHAGDFPTDPWTFTDTTGNYNNQSGTVHDHIDKANATCSISGYSVTYDGQNHTAAGSCTGVGGASDVLAGLDKSGTMHKNAGDYPADPWTFTDTTGNYNNQSGTVHDHIDKANATCSISGYAVPYDGGSHTATGQCTGVGGSSDVLTGLDLTGTTHTNAGAYTDPWAFTDVTGNYNNTSASVTDKINQVTPSVAITWSGWILDGTSHAASATVSGPVSPDNPITSPTVTLTYYSGPTPTGTALSGPPSTVGTYTVKASFAGNTNYTMASATKTVTVSYAAAGTCAGDAGHIILQPINADGSSVSKQGSTIPAKFRVCDAMGNSIGTAGVVASFKLIQTINGTVTTTIDDGTVTSTTPDTAFRWDPTGQQWIFNINTKGLAKNQTYVYLITLNDGSTIQFQFGLR